MVKRRRAAGLRFAGGPALPKTRKALTTGRGGTVTADESRPPSSEQGTGLRSAHGFSGDALEEVLGKDAFPDR